MKKKIALFANGWNNEYLTMALKGIRKCTDEKGMDLFLFLNYAAYNESAIKNEGEFNILKLPDMRKFDGIILFSNTLNSEEKIEELRQAVISSGVPAISFERKLRGIDYIGTDNYSGMQEVAEHLINVHGVRNVIFYGGPRENPESQERLRAVSDTMLSHGMKLERDHIFYGTWAYTEAFSFADDFISTESVRPDAVICGNDNMAFGIIAGLRRHGIRVPEDIIVTGYDNINEAGMYDPAMTTVDRGWDELGYRGCIHLMRRLEGKDAPADEMLPSHITVRESCGCMSGNELFSRIRESSRDNIDRTLGSIAFDWAVGDMENAISEVHDMDGFRKAVKGYYDRHDFLGSDFYAIGERNFAGSINDDSIPLRRLGYSEDMEVFFAVRNREQVAFPEFRMSDLVPGYDGAEEGGHIFLFLPLHYRDYVFGYIVMKDSMSMVEDKSMHTWLERLDQNLEQFRQNSRMNILNIELKKLYIRDPMTGLYNRFGQETVAGPFVKELKKKGSDGIVIFADINRMKTINDMYGHLQGDLAIRTVANAIKENIPEGWMAIRYGGDEFLAVGECADGTGTGREAEEVKDKILHGLEAMQKKMLLPYRLSASIGYQLIDSSSSETLDEYINAADGEMYIHKQEMHRMEDGDQNA